MSKAIQQLDGKVVIGRRIGIQRAKHLEHSTEKSGQIFPATIKKTVNSDGRGIQHHVVRREVDKRDHDQVWIEEEGDQVVKLASSLVASLKQEACDVNTSCPVAHKVHKAHAICIMWDLIS